MRKYIVQKDRETKRHPVTFISLGLCRYGNNQVQVQNYSKLYYYENENNMNKFLKIIT